VGIVLIGASKKAQLVLDFLEQEGRAEEIEGFIDRDPALWNTVIHGKRVLGALETVLAASLSKSMAFCLCMSERFFEDRARITALLAERNMATVSLISKFADVSSSAKIASGSILFPKVLIGMNAVLGTCVTAYTGALIEHDCTISPNVEVASRAVLAGGVKVRSNVFVGINATILPNLTIGDGAIIGGGAVVTKDVDERAVVAGNPARVLHAQTR
jgi:sugar O-acyltransferase (sialic acid O-acetyltransferase NeuD family)